MIKFFILFVALLSVFNSNVSAEFTKDDIIIISNSLIKESIYLGRYYAKKRGIPEESIVEMPMPDTELIDRNQFNNKIILPLKKEFEKRPDLLSKRIFVLIYGVPLSISNDENLAENQTLLSRDNGASVDSELSLLWLLPANVNLGGRLPNPLYKENINKKPPNIAMPLVSRLDGPNPSIVRRLIDASIIVEEEQTLSGNFLIDARGIPWEQRDEFGEWDRDFTSLARSAPVGKRFTIKFDGSPELAEKTENIALYAGWYRVREYNDAYTFVKGAIGYHVASAEAMNIRDPEEKGWCKNLIERGVVSTIGAVDEPYLDSFPKPKEFFNLLLSGKYQLIEAYYLTTKYVSWRLVLFGDPLYKPISSETAKKEFGFTDSTLKKLPPTPSEIMHSPTEMIKMQILNN